MLDNCPCAAKAAYLAAGISGESRKGLVEGRRGGLGNGNRAHLSELRDMASVALGSHVRA